MKNTFDVVLIRHAQSTFNHATQVFTSEMDVELNWWDLINNGEFNKKVTYNKKYMNAQLSDHGKNQCHEVKEKMKDIKVNAIIVSPYTRAMQTCNILFQNHTVPIIVEPLLSEIFRYSCDVVEPLENYKDHFPRFDFSKIQPFGDEWYLSYLPEKTKKTIENAFAQQKAEQTHQKLSTIMDLMEKGQLKEQYGQFKARVDQAKQMIKSYRDKYGPIAVVAHYHTIQFMRAKQFTQDGNVVEYKGVLNCHPYYENIKDLLSKE